MLSVTFLDRYIKESRQFVWLEGEVELFLDRLLLTLDPLLRAVPLLSLQFTLLFLMLLDPLSCHFLSHKTPGLFPVKFLQILLLSSLL